MPFGLQQRASLGPIVPDGTDPKAGTSWELGSRECQYNYRLARGHETPHDT